MDPYSDYTPNASQTKAEKDKEGSDGEVVVVPTPGDPPAVVPPKTRRESANYRRSMTHPRARGANQKNNERRRKRQASDDFINELEKVCHFRFGISGYQLLPVLLCFLV